MMHTHEPDAAVDYGTLDVIFQRGKDKLLNEGYSYRFAAAIHTNLPCTIVKLIKIIIHFIINIF